MNDLFKISTVSNNRGHVSLERVRVICPTTDTIAFYLDVLKEVSRENSSTNEIRIFEFEHIRYIFNNQIDQFVRMRQLDELSTTNQLIHSNFNCVSGEQRDAL